MSPAAFISCSEAAAGLGQGGEREVAARGAQLVYEVHAEVLTTHPPPLALVNSLNDPGLHLTP